jgi:HEAT repeat protein
MKKRRLPRVLLFPAILLLLPFLFWASYAAISLLQGEHFYHGLPTSHWARATRRWLRSEDGWLRKQLPWVPVWFDGPLAYLGFAGKPAVLNGDVAAVPVLVDLLREEEMGARSIAAETLGSLGPAATMAVPALAKALQDEDLFVRRNAAVALCNLGPSSEAVSATVLQLAERGDWGTAFTIFPLWLDCPHASGLLARALRESDPELHELISLGLSVARYSTPAIAGRVQAVLREVVQDQDERVRTAAVLALKQLELAAAEAAVVKKHSPSFLTQLTGLDLFCACLAAAGPRMGEPFCRGLPARYWSWEIRAACRIKQFLRSTGYALELEEYLMIDIWTAPMILADDVQAVPVLADLLADADSDVRLTASAHLDRLGPQALAGLLHALENRPDRVRAAVIHQLDRMGEDAKSATAALTAVLRDKDPVIRKAAGEALANINRRTGLK